MKSTLWLKSAIMFDLFVNSIVRPRDIADDLCTQFLMKLRLLYENQQWSFQSSW